ncbi:MULTISPECIES: iron-containing alcohol dehydrogenase PsrA [unclassified Chelatococcus]|uniref:iron-containing alcohol dehydrogenase PsrA n=1 Tax=unclassified Chelatococcus TaxID=2638111 RepID=UPI001BD175E5|nr:MULTISPECIES: iron-containing alcohol dehydrogenase PsrA [unclassified Chelatococcus]CAH1657023.1 Iron-containing alcohol dehydrogenase [Hyphomicrobiales bacterium]MBS7742368.1 iron-containing alcohol dehydrogenase [Chelatococcus sp. HY11]MBX3542514.1 iron-containing alcohol dehydrogenase [Chelatococcus sp.]MCO5075269.1 iron-containing alcohol dehydrogenase [Chelatococcus sp.]CAH1695948.1 Iron-containing alcohol dehydrogenase [Hyphomicrobiales bacterium]
MTGWIYHNPVKLRFGEGIIDAIGAEVAGRRYLLVTHPDAPIWPWRARVAARAGEPVGVVDTITPNPSLSLLREICQQLSTLSGAIDVIVALGGGSVIDSAKFLAAGHMQFEPVRNYLETCTAIAVSPLPLIAIPTTAGTGSDLIPWATIWDPESDRKLSLSGPGLFAEVALVDPMITASLPWSLTKASGLDALSHALESIWNVNANPVTRTFAVEAARAILTALPRLQHDLGDTQARALLAHGATQAGLAFSNTKTALAHNISYPITMRHGVIHGIACSFCLPEVMVAARGIDPACDAALTTIFGALDSAPDNLRRLLSELGVPRTPAELGVDDEDWRPILERAFAGPRGRNFIAPIGRYPLSSVS